MVAPSLPDRRVGKGRRGFAPVGAQGVRYDALADFAMKQPLRVMRILAPLIALGGGITEAGYFDCNVVYDEFDQLMSKQFLVEPDRYVATIENRLTRKEFLELQQGRFTLHPEREGFGVAVVRTNRNIHGKFVFSWEQSPREDWLPLIVQEAILYGRVDDGYAPRRLEPLFVKPASAVDLDEARVIEVGEPAADLLYDVEDGVFYIEAINGASLSFPVESMCHAPSG